MFVKDQTLDWPSTEVHPREPWHSPEAALNHGSPTSTRPAWLKSISPPRFDTAPRCDDNL